MALGSLSPLKTKTVIIYFLQFSLMEKEATASIQIIVILYQFNTSLNIGTCLTTKL